MEFLQRLGDIGEEVRWLVRDRDGSERVALFVNDHDTPWLARVLAAARGWIGFAHPRVSRVHAVELLAENRAVFLVDDERGPTYADAAATLTDPVDRERWAVAQMITLADALATMAQRSPGFVHRRVEPELLWVDATGRARWRAPIGLVTRGEPGRAYMGAGRVIGTPLYMSPEQGRGIPLTPASDVFSLASNLVLALDGAPPFAPDDNPMNILVAIMTQPARIPRCATPGLGDVLGRALDKSPAARYASPAELAAALYDTVADAGDYDAVISDRIAAWWPTATHDRPSPPTGERCRMRWADLDTTTDPDIRFCSSCRQDVVRVHSVAAALPLYGQRCVSYEPPRG